jgi:predicted amidohydrolase
MRIAVAQTPGTRLDGWHSTLALLDELIDRAADLGAELVVLPECAFPAYVLGSSAAYRAARRTGLPGHAEFLEHLAGQAAARKLAICAGYVEEAANQLFNAASLIDAGGHVLGTHRKCFLWDFDHQTFAAGDAVQPLATAFGPVGIMICADARLPEIPATLVARGARLIMQPTAWVNAAAGDAAPAGPEPGPWNPQPEFLIPARARELGVPIASASKWGDEGGTTFVGGSLICDTRGQVLARCGPCETAVAVADVTLASPAPLKLSVEERAKLAMQAPQLPAADVPPLLVLPLPVGPAASKAVAGLGQTPAGAVLGILPLGEQLAGPRKPVSWIARSDHAVVLAGPAGPFELARIRLAALPLESAASFAPLRCLALEGLHVAIVYGELATMLLQARACENRIFLIGCGPAGWHVIDPRGRCMASGGWSAQPADSRRVRLEPAQAARKLVAPGTDVIRGRRPGQYALG